MSHHPLKTTHVPANSCIAVAGPPTMEPVRLDSPALMVMTDLTHVNAATVHPQDTLSQAEQAMIHQGVRTLFVVRHRPCIEGIIASRDLQGELPLRLMHERNVLRSDIAVSDLMRPLRELDAIDFDLLLRSTVGQVVATLIRFGHPYLMVLEQASHGGPARIRGLISQTQVERQLGTAIPSIEVATTFDEVRRALEQS